MAYFLTKRGVVVEPCLIQEIRGEAEIVFTDGKVIALDGLFIPTRTYITQPWLAELDVKSKTRRLDK